MERDAAAAIFPGGGAAGEQMRATDWARSSLGPPESWSPSLKAHVRAMLQMRQPMSIFWGPDLINLYNDGFLPILGEKHPNAMGERADVVWSDAWPIVGPQLMQVMRGEQIFHEEVLVPISRGGRLEDAWWNYSYSPLIDEKGVSAGVLVICTEVTKEVAARRGLERARAELHGIFMQTPLPICILSGPEHRFTLANPPYLELVQRDVLGKTLLEAFDEAEVAYYLPIMNRVFETGEPTLIEDSPLSLAGVDRFINVGYYPHRDATGAIAGLLVLVQDVSHKVATRKQLETLAVQQSNARKQAEAANRAKDEFLATISHELRTPLTAILGWSRILSKSREPARLDTGIAIIDRNARAQAKIIDDILDASRIISGKLLLHPTPLDVATVVAAAVDSLRPAAAAKSVRLEVDAVVPTPLVADEDRLQQIVWNLVSNAVKFTATEGTVTVRVRRDDGAVRIVVHDTGRGIAPAFLPFVFERFRQADASSTKQHGGLGLGLAIVRSLVELHGGTVSAESEGEGRGATFEVALPTRARVIEVEQVPSDARALWELQDSVAPVGVLRGVRVLVVDDHDDARDIVSTILEDAGAEVVGARDVTAALELLASTEVAAIVSDIGMPQRDGYAFLAEVRAAPQTRHIPALALTAFARREDRDRALAAGFHSHVAKPIDPARLVAAVAALVGRASSEDRPPSV